MFPVFAASGIGSRPDAIAFESGTIDLDFEPPSLLPIRKTPAIPSLYLEIQLELPAARRIFLAYNPYDSATTGNQWIRSIKMSACCSPEAIGFFTHAPSISPGCGPT